MKKLFLFFAVLLCSMSAMADLLPVDASQTKIMGDQLFVYFTGDGGFNYGATQMSQYSCTNVNRIGDKAGAYLYIILNSADASQDRSYELTWSDGANSKCAVIAFAAGETTNPTITECSAPTTRNYKITAYVPDGNAAPYIHFWGAGFNPGTWPQMTATGYANTFEYTVTDAPVSGIQVLFSHSNTQTADQALITDDACYNVYWDNSNYVADPTSRHNFADVKVTIYAASQPSLHYWGMPGATSYENPIVMPAMVSYPAGWYEYTIQNVDVVAGVNYLIRMESNGKTTDQNAKADVVKNAIYHGDWGEHKVELTAATYPQPEINIDWSTIDWVANSGNKFKVGAVDAANLPSSVGNVQKPGWAAKDGIYLTFPAADITCSHNCAVQGAGIILYTGQFVARETLVTVNYAGGSKTFVVYYADGLVDPSAEIPSEYCRAAFSSGNTACRISWETLDNGNVEITLFEPDGSVDATKTHFRGNGVNIARLTVGGDSASIYFNSVVNGSSNVQTLTLKDPAVKPARGMKIVYPESTVEYAVVKDGNAWPSLAFTYTYGGICDALDAPANVAVAANGTITFDAVANAETYEAHVFDGANEVYVGAVTNGGVIDYQVYVAKTLTVRVVAKSSAKADSEFSDAAIWNASASPLPTSVWCDKAGVATTKNNWGDAHFTINTLTNGNVVIVISSPDESAARYRNAKGMNGTFKLNGTEADFNTYFTGSKTSDNTFTLALKNPANKPALGSVIDYSGQIECATSQHSDDWSNYDILGYVYGTKCEEGNVPMTSVALNKTSVVTFVGAPSLTLQAIFTPYNATNMNVTWATSAADVAIVTNGIVTPVAPGEATITVTTEDGGFTASCVVTVINLPAAPSINYGEVKGTLYGVNGNISNNINTYSQHWNGQFESEFVSPYGNECIHYSGMTGVIGWNFGEQDFTGAEYLHIEIYALADDQLDLCPISHAGGQNQEKLYRATLVANQWNVLDIPVTQFATNFDPSVVYQFKFDHMSGRFTDLWVDNVYFLKATQYPVTLNVNGYSTFSAGKATIMPDGLEAFTGTDNGNGTVHLDKIEDGVVPANTGVLLKGTASQAYTILEYATMATYPENFFSATGDERTACDKAMITYALSTIDGVTAFYEYTGDYLPAHKAYLEVAPSAAPLHFTFIEEEVEEGLTTSVENNAVVLDVNAPIYNILGQPVSHTTKGILIQNGKKFLNK